MSVSAVNGGSIADTQGQAFDILDNLIRRATDLRQELRSKPPERGSVLAIFGAALAASANLSADNLASLTTAIRSGRLPRRRATA